MQYLYVGINDLPGLHSLYLFCKPCAVQPPLWCTTPAQLHWYCKTPHLNCSQLWISCAGVVSKTSQVSGSVYPIRNIWWGLTSPSEAMRWIQCSVTEAMESAFQRENIWGGTKPWNSRGSIDSMVSGRSQGLDLGLGVGICLTAFLLFLITNRKILPWTGLLFQSPQVSILRSWRVGRLVPWEVWKLYPFRTYERMLKTIMLTKKRKTTYFAGD